MNSKLKTAFTLIELLVVVAIIAVLVAILLPAIGAARETAKTTLCLTNLRQAGIVFQSYFDMYNDTIPPATWWPQPAGHNADYRIWPWLLLDAKLIREGTGGNAGYPEAIALDAGTYPVGIWRCPSGEAFPRWWMNRTHYAMSGNLTHVNVDELPRNKWYWRVSTLPDPGLKVLLADSWHYAGNNHAIYAGLPDVTSGNSALSFRHREAINLLFFDGHAETKSRGPDDPTLISSRFVLNFCKPPEWTW